MSSDEIDPLSATIKTEYESDVEVGEGSSENESTEDLTTNYHDTRLPMLEDFPGPYDFTYRLPVEGSSSIKPTWEYSHIFNQVFIKMDRVLVVQFAFDRTKINSGDLFVRAVLVYSSADHIVAPVNRCAVHSIEDDPLSKSHVDKDRCLCPQYDLAGHVVRSRSAGAIYCYDPISERHSVLCSVKNNSDMLYSFSCKNSCPKGMHRRSTKMVFTLENCSGKMLGRTSLNVKVCSCPRRDKDKMEKTYLALNSRDSTVSAQSQPDVVRSSTVERQSGPSHGYQEVVGRNSANEEELLGVEEYNDIDGKDPPFQLSGEAIMKIRSEVRNIRQALTVIERRFAHIEDQIGESI